MSGLIQYKESLNNIDDLFELPKKDESALKFLSNKRSLEISKELNSFIPIYSLPDGFFISIL